jgi:UDP-galactopyranose mutase
VLWYYTPMALEFSEHLSPLATVYDCMDELSAFVGAPAEMVRREAMLFERADLVFTGGQSLFESKVHLHPHVRLFPSSIDVQHFARARSWQQEPEDQAAIARPRLGYSGVIDERTDIALLDAIARLRPDWQFVMVGPVVKIDPASLPRHANVHYLGMKPYEQLPEYLAGWDAALMPFARNESTRFISPTKTPEYLAAGRPVVSTSVRDVVRPYGERHLVRIADDPSHFVMQAEAAMQEDAAERCQRVDAFLAGRSWDRTWSDMSDLIASAVASRASLAAAPRTPHDDERRPAPPVQTPVFQQAGQPWFVTI